MDNKDNTSPVSPNISTRLIMVLGIMVVIGVGFLLIGNNFNTNQPAASGVAQLGTKPTQLAPIQPCIGDQNTGGCTSPLPKPISSCTKITTPGSYVLTKDIPLIDGSYVPCIDIQAQNVVLDCQNYKLYDPFLKVTHTSISISYSSNVTIQRCVVKDITGGGIYEQDSSGVIIRNNNLTVTTIATSNSSSTGSAITLYGGHSNQVIGNTIDGGAVGDRTIHNGADDGVEVSSESGDIISNNTIKNIFDCGIETVDYLNNSTVNNNIISNAGICGIGGWYGLSLQGNTFSNNIFSNTFSPFVFYFVQSNRAPISSAYFQNNNFISNVFTNPKSGIPWLPGGHTSEFTMLPSGALTSAGIHVGNNIFKNNDFGSYIAPLIWPVAIGVDGGGNKCGPVESTPPNYMYDNGVNRYPLVCPGRFIQATSLIATQDPLVPANQPPDYLGH